MGDYVERKMKYKDWLTLCNRTRSYMSDKLFFNYYIDHYYNRCYGIWRQMKLWVYLLLFIPGHIIQFFALLFDGGLRMFEVMPRPQSSHAYFYPNDRGYDYCEKLIGNEPS